MQLLGLSCQSSGFIHACSLTAQHSAATITGMLQLTSLTELQLHDCCGGVQLDVLLPLTALQDLALIRVNFLQDKPGAAATQLLAWLGQLQHLTRLKVTGSSDTAEGFCSSAFIQAALKATVGIEATGSNRNTPH